MRKTITALLGATALVIPVANGAAATLGSTRVTAKKKVVTKKLLGQGIEADRWGTVTISVTETLTTAGGKKLTIKFVDLGGNYTYHTDRSQYIMSQALPLLRQEFLAAQSANVQMVSGATDTSQAFIQSLQSALLKAHV
jgi:FMN-binding domain